MDVREKLVELIHKAKLSMWGKNGLSNEKAQNSYIADYMIAHGVTAQEWISVKDDRKPNHGDIALCYMTFGEYRLLQWDDRSKLWVGDYMDFGFEDAAYWQMPQPPKGE
jgi:hypothetical protein